MMAARAFTVFEKPARVDARGRVVRSIPSLIPVRATSAYAVRVQQHGTDQRAWLPHRHVKNAT